MIFTDRQLERRRARQLTLLAYDGDLQSEELEEAADALGVGVVLVLSDRTELVTAAVSRLGHIVGRSNIYALRHSPGTGGVGASITTRPAFGSITAEEMDDFMAANAEIVVISAEPEVGPDPMVTPEDTSATPRDTSATPRDTAVTPGDTSATSGDSAATTSIVLATVDESNGSLSFGKAGPGTRIVARKRLSGPAGAL